ncbi:LysM peptidoglycan-binding domain-containing protein [Domibacillus epiphyticus]|uniref:Spore gernimation protein n=1 Tax=Domibacillus epiphyticus TaxID=1714355 RepID=A0A1V2A3W7_9BACI|nr:LysM peptidoglycan-binding domain-containing protein [Domibacillus epiphyticus]OMP65705.1 spore gernimation protein [Domibacillus epiphyticus]
MKIHVVRRGDTLWRISRQYGISTNRIVEANGLEQPDKLLNGMALVIPEPYLPYTVRVGDTLSQIANQYGITVQEIMQTNRITNPDSIYPGQILFIPVIFHTVRAGDSLYEIATRYGTTVQAIVKENRIPPQSLLYIGQRLRIPTGQKPTIEVNAFSYTFGQPGAQQLREVAYDLTYVSPFGYRMKEDGSLESIDDVPTIQAARSTNVVPMMAITNFSSTEAGTELAHTILSSQELVETLLTNIINTMKRRGYSGLNIDFENVAPADREFYNRFLQRSVDRLHPEGFFVSSSLAPKTSGEEKGLLVEAHDYPAHGRILDFVVLMTYEWGYRKGPPQAISPIDQIKRVLDYAVTVIPREKILLGFQIYARDWIVPHREGQEAETFDMQEAIRRAINYNSEIKYDQRTQSPFFTYIDNQGRSHEVWFEDARSAKAKFDLVKTYNLRGLSYWVLGYPFPQNWALLGDTFIVRKL